MTCLACTVRTCGAPLERKESTWVCVRGHSYDEARSGYVNLLQPQDRRSAAPGDSKDQVAARARLLAAGIGATIVDAFVRRAASLELGPRPHVVDLGSGSGEVLGGLVRGGPIAAVGIDLSSAAADHAARRYPDVTWVVANADRRLPMGDATMALVVSLHGRRNPGECARVLVPGGWLLVGVPGRDDLGELRASVQGQSIERDRIDAVVDEHAPGFTLRERSSATERQLLSRESLLDVLRGTYRGARKSDAARLEALETLEVTLASDFLLFARRG